uniref:MBD domain-containing protein n=1 Tax=Physcomitrium patens TaxID=3218 RepID=A0A2K1KM63_PHYPA|nr:methyl-CpG-binding domain-containing protein 1-like isoform X1 [Physcomitrium patens]XP_024374472.1 methyl-CpG-binding domain-containing protein 1-like isoform X1 [Physcomitrium patens]XP_024374473.1 methyl-CpG-binding domain-containing protein 1-like isoform X1 [Physcomitrium patens]XP_024374474.1 methyl-CpG-binding domain-containing protein 1-like isoform X1 [Physcomitrium patens]XP_024374475.1 methyl-CpG-binding domain-containing protein 1-like isoform X1 [Physcomitrium patens]PNR54854.1|eukprot:XP_024374471.1 methyl-CpG-binding domain-containing protein 1-like isoform X1 [Physcomitrella patens]
MLDNELKERGTAQDPSEAGRESNKLLCQEKGSPSGLSRDKVDGGVSQDHSAKDEALETGQDAPRWASSAVEIYAIQCNACFKWRIIPTKEKYEALREHILEQPFICVQAQEWRENSNCDDPADIDNDEPTVLWAIDKHDIPRPPEGFSRRVVLRAENAKKFADVYYSTPCGKTLRSLPQVQKYLDEHPEHGAQITQFSFTSPKGRADASGAGVSTKRSSYDGKQLNTEPRKRMKGSVAMPPRHRPPSGEKPHAKHKNLSASKSNAMVELKTKLEQIDDSGSPAHLGMKIEEKQGSGSKTG